MGQRKVRSRIETLPSMTSLGDKAGSEPSTPQEQEGLAELAVLSGVNPSNAPVATFVRRISNSTLTEAVQGVT